MPLPRRARLQNLAAILRSPQAPALSALEVRVLQALGQPLDFAVLEQAVLRHQHVTPLELLTALRSLEAARCVEFRGPAGVHRRFVRTEFSVTVPLTPAHTALTPDI